MQAAPQQEAKLVRCVRGRVFDVIVDLRRGSATFSRWYAVELSASALTMLYVPEGLAHGYQTLEDDTELLYHMSKPFDPATAVGVRWNDPFLGIRWPIPDPVVSAGDRGLPDLQSIG